MSYKIMYVCETCADDVPENCGHFDRADLRVMSDGTWICDGCFDDWEDRDGGWDDFPVPPKYVPEPSP